MTALDEDDRLAPPPGTWVRLCAWFARHTPDDRRRQVDPLRNTIVAIAVTFLVVITAAASLTISLASGAPHKLPAVALSSPALFHLQRALIPTLGVAFFAMFLVRAAFGYFPQRVSTTGAEWAAAAGAERDRDAAAGLRTLGDVVERLSKDQRAQVERDDSQTAAIGTIRAAAQEQRRFALALHEAFVRTHPGASEAFDEAWRALEPSSSSD